MFNNIGGKIKTLATFLTIIGIIGSGVWGLSLMLLHEDLILSGLLIILVGSLSSWIASFLLYGFGEIIDELKELNSNSRKMCALLETKRDSIFSMKSNTVNTKDNTLKTIDDTFKMVTHAWMCTICGNMISEYPCSHCGWDGKE